MHVWAVILPVGATKGIINDWKESKHALNNVTCDKCHEAADGDKDAISHNGFLITTTPSPKDCAKCHSTQVSQFNSGKHIISWTKMTVAARYKAIPNEKMRESMYEGCHSIGKVVSICPEKYRQESFISFLFLFRSLSHQFSLF